MLPGVRSSAGSQAAASMSQAAIGQSQKPSSAPASTSEQSALAAKCQGQIHPRGYSTDAQDYLSGARSGVRDVLGEPSRALASRSARLPHSTAGDRIWLRTEAKVIRQQSDAYLDRLCEGSEQHPGSSNLVRILKLGGRGAQVCRSTFAGHVAQAFSSKGEFEVRFSNADAEAREQAFMTSVDLTLQSLRTSDQTATKFIDKVLTSPAPSYQDHPVRLGFHQAVKQAEDHGKLLGKEDREDSSSVHFDWREEFIACFQVALANTSDLGKTHRSPDENQLLHWRALELMALNPVFTALPD